MYDSYFVDTAVLQVWGRKTDSIFYLALLQDVQFIKLLTKTQNNIVTSLIFLSYYTLNFILIVKVPLSLFSQSLLALLDGLLWNHSHYGTPVWGCWDFQVVHAVCI